MYCSVLSYLFFPTGLCSCVPEGEISSFWQRCQIYQELLPQRGKVLSISKSEILL